MTTVDDFWYVRLPSGRVIRARNTVALRHQVRRGRIPPGSRVRRAPAEAWLRLEEVQEFAEAMETAAARSGQKIGQPVQPRRSRAAFQQGRLLGIRTVVRELLDALDSSFHRTKLAVAGMLALLAGVAWIGWDLSRAREGTWWTVAAVSSLVLLILAACAGISFITQYTAVELSRMRAPRREELWPTCMGQAVRLAVALLVVAGAALSLIVLMRWLPNWMLEEGPVPGTGWEYGAAAVLSVRLILEVIFWPMIALAPLLLGPILVVHDGSVLTGIREWWSILRKNLGKIFLYESMAAALGALFTIPLLIPIGLASWSMASLGGLQLLVGQITMTVLTGIALTPLIAYLLVANVFIYLNLRYEFFHSER